MQKAKKKVIFSSLSWLAVARGHSLYIAFLHPQTQQSNMTKAKNEAESLANFVKTEYTASRTLRGIMKRETVVASRGSLKWARCSAAVVCSHAVPETPTPTEGRARKAFADYLVSAEADAEASADADDDGADD
jgi:hypothetical protein